MAIRINFNGINILKPAYYGSIDFTLNMKLRSTLTNLGIDWKFYEEKQHNLMATLARLDMADKRIWLRR